MRITLGHIMIAVATAGPACWGQGIFDQLNFRNAELGGFGVYGLSVYSGYTTYGKTANGQIPSSTDYGASFSAGWQHHQPYTNSSIIYSGTYGGLVQYPQFNGYSQSFTFNVSQKIARKWNGTLSGSARDYSLSESLFQPSALSVTSQLVSSFNDFAAALGLGQFSSSQVQSLYQNAFLDSAVRSGLLGGRVLSYGGQAALTYSYSPNLNVSFTGFTGGGQSLHGSQETAPQPNYAMPLSWGGTVNIAYSHSFSPRTQVGIDLNDYYVQSRYAQASISTATASYARKMSSRWFIRAYGGGSYTNSFFQSSGPKTLTTVGGGSIGFQMLTNTLAGTYDRSAASAYGFAVGASTNIAASWSWHRLGSKFSLQSSFSQEQQRGTGFLSISGWVASAGISEALNTQTALSVQYAYLDSTARYPVGLYQIKTNSVRASLSWSPHPARR